RVVLDFEHHEHVAARTALRTDAALLAERHVLARRDPRGNGHAERPLGAHAAFALAALARCVDDRALPRAGGARGNAHELPEEGALGAAHFARAVARRAALGRGARLGSRAFAAIEELERELLVDAGGDFLQRERHGDLDVGAAARAAALAAAEHVLEAAESAEV